MLLVGLAEGQAGEGWEHSEKSAFSEMSEHWTEKYLYSTNIL
jgi:hypothetical protein